jgi:hypothetical protein
VKEAADKLSGGAASRFKRAGWKMWRALSEEQKNAYQRRCSHPRERVRSRLGYHVSQPVSDDKSMLYLSSGALAPTKTTDPKTPTKKLRELARLGESLLELSAEKMTPAAARMIRHADFSLRARRRLGITKMVKTKTKKKRLRVPKLDYVADAKDILAPVLENSTGWSKRARRPMMRLTMSLRACYRKYPTLIKLCSRSHLAKKLGTSRAKEGIGKKARATDVCSICWCFSYSVTPRLLQCQAATRDALTSASPSFLDDGPELIENGGHLFELQQFVREKGPHSHTEEAKFLHETILRDMQDLVKEECEHLTHDRLRLKLRATLNYDLDNPSPDTLYVLSDWKECIAASVFVVVV